MRESRWLWLHNKSKRNLTNLDPLSKEEIDLKWFEGVKTVGICGATSTPKWLMEECRDYILRSVKK